MSEWLFDLGNSRLKCAPLIDGRVGAIQAVAHDGLAFEAALSSILPDRIDAAWISSVAGTRLSVELLDTLTPRCRRLCIARTQAAFAGVQVAYAHPRALGVDRFLALLAARARGTGACLVAGIGTALTIDLLDAGGVHLGGRIAPSPALMREALHRRAPQLPPAGGGYVEFAGTTADALASGCEGAAMGLVGESLAAAARRLGAPPALLLHGGGAEALLAHLPHALHAPALVLEGLLAWRAAATARAAAG